MPHRAVATLLAFALTLAAAPALAGTQTTVSFQGRDVIVYAPDRLAPPEARALVLVLHGGLGSAAHIVGGEAETALNLNQLADQDGFVVAYLNGTAVTRMMGDQFKGWNAGGGCCGVPAQTEVDDVAYVKAAAASLAAKYAVAPSRVFGIGHSNGAMMIQREVCEAGVFAAIVPISGPLTIDGTSCPAAAGRRVLAIHGAIDANVPMAGGRGKGLSDTAYKSEARSEATMTAAGASYTLDVVPGADHFLQNIDAALQKTEGVSVQQKAAAFFGLTPLGN
ncbi:MAG TPA: hypothetical protein VGL58_04250 [Caulobacteraceae bacterium]|jgi:polyhydroxybutyrate depolymerase